MKLLAAAVAALAVAIFGGALVLAQALDRPTAYEIDVIRDACTDAHPGDVSLCILDTLDRGP